MSIAVSFSHSYRPCCRKLILWQWRTFSLFLYAQTILDFDLSIMSCNFYMITDAFLYLFYQHKLNTVKNPVIRIQKPLCNAHLFYNLFSFFQRIATFFLSTNTIIYEFDDITLDEKKSWLQTKPLLMNLKIICFYNYI